MFWSQNYSKCTAENYSERSVIEILNKESHLYSGILDFGISNNPLAEQKRKMPGF